MDKELLAKWQKDLVNFLQLKRKAAAMGINIFNQEAFGILYDINVQLTEKYSQNQMISCDLFVKTIEAKLLVEDTIRLIYDEIKVELIYCDELIELISLPIEIMNEIFDNPNKNDFYGTDLDYAVYEMDYLQNQNLLSAEDLESENFKDWDNFYNYLVKIKELKK